jgi:hypothetical protein
VNAQIEELKQKCDGLEISYAQSRQLEMALIRISFELERAGLPPNVRNAVMEFDRLIMTIRMAQLAIYEFEVASGPIGWAIFGLSAVSTLFLAGDLVTEVTSH